MIYEFDINEIVDDFDRWMDEQSPSNVVAMYETMNLEAGLGEWEEQPHVANNRQGFILRNISYGFMGLSGVGLLMLIGSFFLGGRKAPQS